MRIRLSKLMTACALVLCACWLVFGVSPGYARAQEPEAAALEQASRHFDRGVELVQSGSYDQAVIEFERAYTLSGSPAVLYNLGMAYVAVERPVEACDALTRYLQHQAPSVRAEDRERIEQELARQCSRVGVIQLELQPPAARVTIDGRAFGPETASQPLRLAVGNHWLEATLEGYQPIRVVLSVTATAQRVPIRLLLLRESTRPSYADAVVPPSSPQVDKPALQPAYRTTGYVLGAVGLAAEVAALTVYLISDARYDKWSKEEAELAPKRDALDDPSVDLDALNVRQGANDDLWSSVRALDKAAMGLAIGGAALLVAGVTLVWTSAARGRRADRATEQLQLRPGGLGFRRAF